MSVTRDTSHSPIGPCGPSAQSLTDDILRHSSTAFLRSFRFFGVNTAVEGIGVGALVGIGCTQRVRESGAGGGHGKVVGLHYMYV